MSYKKDMEFFCEDSSRFRKKLVLIIKITLALFAVVAVCLSVFLAMDISNGAGWNNSSSGGDSGGSSSKDNRAPTIIGPIDNTIYIGVGETISYKNAVTATDDSGKCTLEVTNNNVNTDVAGTYSVTYVARDAAGNTSKLIVNVVVTKSDYTPEMLMDVVENLTGKLGITANMSTAQKVRKIYEYVNDPDKNGSAARIYFTDESNVPNIDRSKWQSDWVEEAYRTLKPLADGNSRTEGDCYSYYAASKAFFEYYNIDHRGIKRDDSGTNMDGTHFWLMVNVGTASDPAWYFYDATRLAGEFSDGSNECCLRTAEELDSYEPSQSGEYGFYAFDADKYPKTSTQKTNFN